MNDERPLDKERQQDQGLFKKYPKLSILIIALVAYAVLFAMCAIVAVLLIRG